MLTSQITPILKNPLIGLTGDTDSSPSEFSPADIDGLVFCFDATNSASITHTSGAVDRWNDISGNGYYATSTGSNRPNTGTRSHNGENVIDFTSASTHYLSLTHDNTDTFNALKLRLLSEHTLFVIGKPDVPAGNKTYIGAEQSGGADRYYVAGQNNALRYYSGSAVRTESHGTEPFIAMMGRNPANDTVFQSKDGKVLNTTAVNPALTAIGTITFGAVNTAGQDKLDGWISKIILYDRQLTAGEIAQFEEWASLKYGILLYYEDFSIVPLAGQSNMQGYSGSDTVPVIGEPNPRILELNLNSAIDNNTPKLAVQPLDHPVVNPAAGASLGYRFAQRYITDNPNKKILLIASAVGSTGFAGGNWNDGNTLHEQLVSRTNAALAWGTGTKTLIPILFHQGEADAVLGTTEVTHASNMDAMITAFRASITGASNIGFICGGLVPNFNNPTYDGVKAAIADTPNRVTNSAYVSSVGLTDVGDNLHFDAESLAGDDGLGDRYYEAYKTLVGI